MAQMILSEIDIEGDAFVFTITLRSDDGNFVQTEIFRSDDYDVTERHHTIFEAQAARLNAPTTTIKRGR